KMAYQSTWPRGHARVIATRAKPRQLTSRLFSMATTHARPDLEGTISFSGVGVPAWPREQSASTVSDSPAQDPTKPWQRDALQALLAFSALHNQVRRRKALAARTRGFDAGAPVAEFEQDEQF